MNHGVPDSWREIQKDAFERLVESFRGEYYRSGWADGIEYIQRHTDVPFCFMQDGGRSGTQVRYYADPCAFDA